jgi:uncharacterized cofD-like protein
VAIGGGTGLPLVLRCLVELGFSTTAVVTVADDGGSSGSLRRELGILPPGDIRNCLVALAQPDHPLAEVFQYRFAAGEGLAGHALGNLIIAALADLKGGFAEGIEAAAALLGSRGRVLPSTLADVVLSAEDECGDRITGQANVARSPATVHRVHMNPPEPPAYPPVIEAIGAADLVVIGPGSLYTSVIPNLLVAGIAGALARTDAQVVYACNVANQRGETTGMDAADHVAALLLHGLEGVVDTVVMHQAAAAVADGGTAASLVAASAAARDRIAGWGINVVATPLASKGAPMQHDPDALRTVLGEVAGVVHR